MVVVSVLSIFELVLKSILMKIFQADFVLFGLFLFMLIAPFETFSQEIQSGNRIDYNYSKFKSEFEKEFGIENSIELQEKPSNITRVFFKTKLPEWVFNIPSSNDSIVYAIGVSEPGMEKDSAFQLACLRSKAILAILTNSKLEGINDYYINEKDIKSGDIISSVYQEFNKLKGKLSFNDADFSIVEEAFTANNEAIVLSSLHIDRKSGNDLTNINCFAEISSSNVKKNNKYSTSSRIELIAGEQSNLKNSSSHFYYVIKNSNKNSKILSDFLGVRVSSDSNLMTYKSNDINGAGKENDVYSCSLQHGLWHAFTTVLLQTIVLDFNESYTKQSGLSDDYTKLTQNINRVLSQKEISMRINGLHIKNNTLYLESVFLTQDLNQ
jgi:hypothetical protein